MQIKTYAAAALGLALLSHHRACGRPAVTPRSSGLRSAADPGVHLEPASTSVARSATSSAIPTPNGFDNRGVGVVAAGSSPNGVVGGAHAGYNFSTQSIPVLGTFAGGFGGAGGVIGIEGDVDGSDYKKSYALGGINSQVNENIQGSIRGRLGFAYDRVLFYRHRRRRLRRSEEHPTSIR